jgi:uncharacterized membrane protein YgcG
LVTSHAIVLKVVAVVALATIVVRKDIASKIAPTLARSFVVIVMLRVMRVANAPFLVTTLVSSAPTAKKWDTQRSAARLPSRLRKRAVMQVATMEVMPQAMVEFDSGDVGGNADYSGGGGDSWGGGQAVAASGGW